jgi:glycosyltransferase involved in cell wall biosynthesis
MGFFYRFSTSDTKVGVCLLSKTKRIGGVEVMVSFIVIGKNEEQFLRQSLESVGKLCRSMQTNTEIIYVDSASTDSSVDIACEMDEVSVYQLIADNNAAIARNVGAEVAKGEILVFVDGDMQVLPQMQDAFFDKQYQLVHPFISGNWENQYYNEYGKTIHREVYKKIACDKDTFQYTTGGLFAITKQLWNEVDGMNNTFAKGQDLDLGFRLSKQGTFLLRRKHIVALHHTVHYMDKYRIWKDFKNGALVLPRSILYRTHLGNKYVIKRMISSDPTMLFLIAALVVTILGHYEALLLYPVVVIAGIFYSHGWHGIGQMIIRSFHQFFRDAINILSFIFYYPPKNDLVKYYKINA